MAKTNVEPPEEAPDLGVAVGLGLPLQPKVRGRVHRLPPVRVVLDGRVPLPVPPSGSEIETAIATIQAGRLRMAALIRRGLLWTSGTRLAVEAVQLDAGVGRQVPAVVLYPSRKAPAGRVNDELRVTLRGPERYHLGIEESGDQVLLAFRHSDPTIVLALGSPGLSVVMSGVWPDALR